MDADSDHSDTDYYDEADSSDNTNTFDRLPLVPTDFSSIQEALHNFVVVFESRYGGNHPRFVSCSLRDALDESFGTPCVMERKPFALYLHNDDAVAANIFAQNILCGEAMVPLLSCQYTVWPWDVTQEDNRRKFVDWLSELGMSDVRDTILMQNKADYPLLVLIYKERSTYQVAGMCRGHDITSDCVEKVMACLDQYQLVKTRDLQEEQSRMERQQIRQEQVDEYEKSKAIDRARQQEQERKRNEEIAEQKRLVEEEEARRQRQAEIASSLPAEPAPNAPNVTMLRVCFPNGEQKVRRFNDTDQLKWLVAYVESEGFPIAEHRMWTSDFPRKDVASFDATQSFKQLGWPAREKITVEEK